MTSDRRLAVINISDGSRRYLTESGFRSEYGSFISYEYPAPWSPDGTHILFMASPEIYMVDTNGGDPIPVTKSEWGNKQLYQSLLAPGPMSVDPVWSPDGTQFAFMSIRDSPSYQIYIADADGRNPTRLTDPTIIGDAAFPAWSPDGTRIVFTSSASPQGIYVINTDGSNLLKLSNIGQNLSARRPSWSPDGVRITFANNGSIYIVNVDGSNLHKVTDSVWWDGSPAWSPSANFE